MRVDFFPQELAQYSAGVKIFLGQMLSIVSRATNLSWAPRHAHPSVTWELVVFSKVALFKNTELENVYERITKMARGKHYCKEHEEFVFKNRELTKKHTLILYCMSTYPSF